jgi:arylsulfatase A-like enzyme
MVMSMRPVHMAVGDFFFRGGAHFQDVRTKAQGLAGQTTLPTSHVDLARTLLALALGPQAGQRVADEAPALDGRSLLDAARVEPIFAYSLLGDGMLAARFGPHKLVKSRDITLLFDLSDDPAEQRDLAADRPELTTALSSAVDRFVVGARAAAERR